MITHYLDSVRSREISVALTGDLDAQLRQHFVHEGRQEDLTFVTWRWSHGTTRSTMVLQRALLPSDDERILTGNVSFTSEYLTRTLGEIEPGEGFGLIHSHLGPGWQGMSFDDVVAERDRLAGAVAGRTGLPLLGMTWGTDGTWSARAWARSQPFVYERVEIPVVRVVGADRLSMSFHPRERPEPAPVTAQEATVSVWGVDAQNDIARTRVGIVGLGSVGSIVAEALSRVGFSDLVLLDFDHIKIRNLDRTMHATREDADSETKKVHVAARGIADSHTAPEIALQAIPETLLSEAGVLAALDCDVLISCVDRPWPGWVLNGLAYAHLIPVVDGGIFAAVTPSGRPLHIDWRIHTVGPGRACLVCLGALLRSDVGLDRDGLLDDPDYIANLPPSERERYSRRNVFPFSLAVAAHEVLQLVGMIAGSSRVSGIGPQHYQAYPGRMEVTATQRCEPDCEFDGMTAGALPLADQFRSVSAHPGRS
jgi:hypothetical protein